MDDRKQSLRDQLRDVNERIKDLEARIPPHSVKPTFISQLDELEAERDRILAAIEAENSKNTPAQGG